MKIEQLSNGKIEVTNGEFKLIQTSVSGIKFNTAMRKNVNGVFKIVGILEYKQIKELFTALHNFQNQ